MAESNQGLEKMGREKMGYLGAPWGWKLPLPLQERDLLSTEDSLQADPWKLRASRSCLGTTVAISSCVTRTPWAGGHF